MSGELERFAFGDNAQMADDLLALVLAGTKTATCGALADYEKDGAALPKPGQRSIVLNGKGQPACIIETTQVRCQRFDAVDADFAREEGEGDLSLSHWQGNHARFFRRNGGFSPDMMVVCRNFRLIERLGGAARP
jgi:uncharacterized protein YhfF